MIWYVLALGSAILAACSSLIEKRTLMKEHAMEFSTVFSILALIVVSPLVFFADFTMPSTYWYMLALLGVLDAVAFLYLTKAIRHMELSEASPLFTFGPAMTAILALIMLEEIITIQHISGMVLVVIGAYVLELKPHNAKADILQPIKRIISSRYIHYILFGLLLYSLSAIIARFLLNTENPDHVDIYAFLFLLHLFVAITFLVFISVFHDGIKGIVHGMRSAGRWIFLTAIFLVASRFLLSLTFAIPGAQVALTLSIKRLSSLFSTIFGGEIFKDKNLGRKVLACIIMVIGAIIVVL